jgi:hypothetical protein
MMIGMTALLLVGVACGCDICADGTACGASHDWTECVCERGECFLQPTVETQCWNVYGDTAYAAFQKYYGKYDRCIDYNRDGVVNYADLVILAHNWQQPRK